MAWIETLAALMRAVDDALGNTPSPHDDAVHSSQPDHKEP